ncbi:hypothetical protein [Herbaspirillum sp. YR522]|uniref:hypothetical protein n=1 Tax=Herbaspirillum sp. YR522 TaxID=1144342 RepID=UPI00026FB34C|nr:hypothetical protein [Herbaspirillum sp. YR522]EJN07793.1 hypothetical protein PMI40_01689 [Herbaspirillum sp. YR522]
MALSEAQMTDVRRYMGYQLAGNSMPITDDNDLVYGAFGMVTMSLHRRLTTLTQSEEQVLTANFLGRLNELEADIYGARENLDTDEAAVWKHNKQEVGDRFGLYNRVRMELCRFIGFRPGSGLAGSASVSLVRS